MKHQFPKGKTICCTEKHTYSQGKEFVETAVKLGVKVDEDTFQNFYDENYPFFIWYKDQITQCQNPLKLIGEVSYLTFKEFFELLGSTRKAEIEKLFSTI